MASRMDGADTGLLKGAEGGFSGTECTKKKFCVLVDLVANQKHEKYTTIQCYWTFDRLKFFG